ncbi:MAG: Ig-like domain-containing protein, partial [Gemmatimonadota bacterium]|nr:Ig-like domain-containing protein [Gemmatimonadota bacterium]
ALANAPVVWNVGDPTLGAVSAGGAFAGAGRRGTVRIVATTWSGVADTVPLVLRPVATRLAIVSGDGQSAPAGSPLPQPVVVEADAIDGPVAGVVLHFAAAAAGASVIPDSAVTDAAGRATVRAALGSVAGTQSFAVTAAGVPTASFGATATAVATALSKVSGDVQVDSVGVTLNPFVVAVTDSFGNPAPGATVNWTVVAGTGSLSAGTSTTDASGKASVLYTLSKTVRTDSVRATLAGSKASVVFTAASFQRGVAALAVISGDGQSGAVGTTLPASLVVEATDALGNPVAGAGVSFSTASPGASIAPSTATTDPAGRASATLTLGTLAGTYTYGAASGKAAVSVKAVATASVATTLLKISGDGQSDTACATLKNPLVVQATDAFGNGVPGAGVLWAQVGGPGSHNSAALTTDSIGYSAIAYQLPNTAGVDTLSATLSLARLQSVTFVATITTTHSGACPAPSAVRAWVRR